MTNPNFWKSFCIRQVILPTPGAHQEVFRFWVCVCGGEPLNFPYENGSCKRASASPLQVGRCLGCLDCTGYPIALHPGVQEEMQHNQPTGTAERRERTAETGPAQTPPHFLEPLLSFPLGPGDQTFPLDRDPPPINAQSSLNWIPEPTHPFRPLQPGTQGPTLTLPETSLEVRTDGSAGKVCQSCLLSRKGRSYFKNPADSDASERY